MEEEENGRTLYDLRETEICLLGQHKLDGNWSYVTYVECYVIKVPDLEACTPPSYFSCPIFKLKHKRKQPLALT